MIGCFVTHCITALLINGTIATFNGYPVGKYVDDTVPHQCQVVSDSRSTGYRGLIIAAHYPQHGRRCANATDALEWYPYRFNALATPSNLPCGWPAYIIQWKGDSIVPPAPPSVRRALLRKAESCHPQFIFKY